MSTIVQKQPKHLKTVKYIEMDSSYRNRARWPNPAAFVTQTSPTITSDPRFSSEDPIIDSYPIYKFKGNMVARTGVIRGGTVSYPVIDPDASGENQFYKGAVFHCKSCNESSVILSYTGRLKLVSLQSSISDAKPGQQYQILDPSDAQNILMPHVLEWTNAFYGMYLYDVDIDEYRTITGFDTFSNTLTLETPFSGAWKVTDSYEIKHTPYVVWRVPVGKATTLTASKVSLDGIGPNTALPGMYVRYVDDAAAIDVVRRIVSVDSSTPVTVTVAPPLEKPLPIQATTRLELMNYSRDNTFPLNLHNTCLFDTGLYEVELKSLILPNLQLNTHQGGRLVHYPYVYVEFGNISSGRSANKNILISNNPNSVQALFKVPITDVQLPISSSFLKLFCLMKQTIILSPYDNLGMRVTLPSGELFSVNTPDNFSPKAPNPYVQISATFAINRVDMY